MAEPSRDLMIASSPDESITVQHGALNLEVFENGLD